MIRHLDVTDLGSIVARGAGVTISARQFNAIELGAIAARLTGAAVLHVVDSQRLNAIEMGSIAARAPAPAYVMFSGEAA